MRRIYALLALLITLPAAAAPGPFSATGLRGWMEQAFNERQPVRYRLVRDAGVQVLEADCAAAASGWLWKETIDLERTPILAWRWKAQQIPQGASERDKAGDDFAARVYVVRNSGWPPWEVRSLVYVWARQEPAGADWRSAYTAKARHVALRSGGAELGQWREERRDLRADFRRYFGTDIETVDAVALMTDCDDGGGAARAWYGDIHFEPAAR